MLDKSPATAADLMTRDVLTVRPETGLAQVASLMAESGISSLPVVGPQGEVIGMISDGDLVRWFEGLVRGASSLSGGSGPRPAELLRRVAEDEPQVAAVMAREVIAIPETMPARDVAALMHAKGVKRFPVLGNGRLVGIIARSDLVRALAAELQDVLPPEPGTNDERRQLEVEQDLNSAEAQVRLNRALRRRRSGGGSGRHDSRPMSAS